MSEDFDTTNDPTHRTDTEHLRILSILHYVWGGLQVFGGLGGLMFVVMGGVIASGQLPANSPNDRAAMQLMGTLFSVMGLVMVVFCVVVGAAIAYAGLCLSRSQAYIYCFIIAALECLSMPLGTALGVFTIVVLLRESVKARFEGAGRENPADAVGGL